MDQVLLFIHFSTNDSLNPTRTREDQELLACSWLGQPGLVRLAFRLDGSGRVSGLAVILFLHSQQFLIGVA